jgi:hypothetical protein
MNPDLLTLPPLVLIAAAAGARLWTIASRHLRTRHWIRYLRTTLPTWAADDELEKPHARSS